MQRSTTRIRTSHVGRLPPPKGWEDMPARLANAEVIDSGEIASHVVPAITETRFEEPLEALSFRGGQAGVQARLRRRAVSREGYCWGSRSAAPRDGSVVLFPIMNDPPAGGSHGRLHRTTKILLGGARLRGRSRRGHSSRRCRWSGSLAASRPMLTDVIRPHSAKPSTKAATSKAKT